MSFTRFHDDPARIQKQLEQMTYSGKYMMNVPGNGANMNFQEDPHIRLEKWGANLSQNAIDIESDLRCQTRNLQRDCVQYQEKQAPNHVNSYGSTSSYVEQSRAIAPAWEIRGLKQERITDLPYNPQTHIEMPFLNNLQTRILEKDYYKKC
jgi:hypothetical protein